MTDFLRENVPDLEDFNTQFNTSALEAAPVVKGLCWRRFVMLYEVSTQDNTTPQSTVESLVSTMTLHSTIRLVKEVR